ncbi:MAG: nucleotidyltransferase domain-containing protein [Ignavibacteriae bacterium]|nr:nucleotidyltransferase domain-containing protein [Ignavibacteriota bacterium]
MKKRKNNNNFLGTTVEDAITRFFQAVPNVVAVFLFGSVESGRQRKESDVDIAVLFKTAVTCDHLNLIGMQQELSDLVSRDVDLVCLNNAPVILRMQVLKKGKKLLDRNARETNTFIRRTSFEYDDLKRMRRPIERQILKERIYG